MKHAWVLCWASTIALVTTMALGQSNSEPDAFINQQRAAADRVNEMLDAEMPLTQDHSVDFGGSYSFHLFIFDDGVNSSRTLRRNDLRLWTHMQFDKGAHQIYARTRLTYMDFNTGDSYDGNDDDWEGPNLERGYYVFDLQRAMKAYANKDIDYNVRAKIGRDLVRVGTGLALWETLDHVEVQTTCPAVELTGLAGKSVGSNFDFDETRPTDRTHRSFFAGQLTYLGLERHRPFAYVLWQQDHNRDTRYTQSQSFGYDSFYVGLGSTGELVDNLRYSAEWVYESGHTYSQQELTDKSVIRAWAFDAQIEYLFDVPTHPRVSTEYLFASGDSNRTLSPTDTVSGNISDDTDRGFNGFGYRDTGLSFAPRMSNLHMWRTGASFFPFEEKKTFERLELGTDWFLYWKHQREGAVSDVTADVQSSYLGWEMDYFCNWAITNDLTWTVRLGAFFPGDAFSDQTTRTFLLTGMTWSF